MYYIPVDTSVLLEPHPGLEWCIFHILTGEDVNDFTDIKLSLKLYLNSLFVFVLLVPMVTFYLTFLVQMKALHSGHTGFQKGTKYIINRM